MRAESSLSPAMRQWHRVKEQHPGEIVLFRMGDFYEMFGDDARLASRVLEIVLTTREKGKADPMPMAGIPYHALDGYLARLIKNGHRVVLCEQMEKPSEAKGPVRREVVRVVTPGTVLEDGVVDASEPVILASWNPGGPTTGLAWADLSSGDVVVWQSSPNEALERLRALSPSEILYPEGTKDAPEAGGATPTPLPPRCFRSRDAAGELARRFSLPRGLPGIPAEEGPLGALLALLGYVRDSGSQTLRIPRYEIPGTFVAMDEATRKNLELTVSLETGGREGTLLEALDGTRTPMGARLLKSWLLSPPSAPDEIKSRHDTVGAWLSLPGTLSSFRNTLKVFPDLARLAARFGAGLASPRDAGNLRSGLAALPGLASFCKEVGEKVTALDSALGPCELWRERLEVRLEENLPPRVGDGGIFAAGWHDELDALRELTDNVRGAILALETKERERSGINSLKVRYNRVFGYFLEVSKANSDKVPEDYERRQTLVNAERYVTPELKKLEFTILSAGAKREALEERLWEALVDELKPLLPLLRDAAAEIARMDLLAAFAQQARERAYVRPVMAEEPVLELEESRHPVLELDPRHQPFVPNPVCLDTGKNQVVILTGPNMGGKSTYLRQAALITVMAHAGAYVPAKRAVVGLTDRIFCRVGAGDSLLRGLSTFMVEMTETAAILKGATERSLVILDEVGRGTSTYDGLAIAWAVVEALLHPKGIGCRTLFATHYHELTELGWTLNGVVNRTMGVREYMGKVHFLRTVEEGAADKSYGIHVAELAGVPEGVVGRARELLDRLEKRREDVGLCSLPPGAPRQPTLFGDAGKAERKEIFRALRAADLSHMTPVNALLFLDRLKKKLGDSEE